jgi:hypothetical protein
VSARADLREALQAVRLHVLEGLVAEAEMAYDDEAMLRAMKADAKLMFACRNVASAVAESLPRDRPEGWDLTPGGDTA